MERKSQCGQSIVSIRDGEREGPSEGGEERTGELKPMPAEFQWPNSLNIHWVS